MTSSLFVTDLDGTLLTDDRTLSLVNYSCLKSLQKKGIITAIATGRSNASFFHAVSRAMNLLGKDIEDLPVDYLICSTGAGIIELSSGKLLCSWSLTRQQVAQICRYFDKNLTDYMVHKALPHTIYFEYKFHGNNNPDFQTRLKLYKEESRVTNPLGTQFDLATQVLAILPEPISLKRVHKLRSDLFPYSVVQTTSPLDKKSSWVEVFNNQVCKSNACKWLSNYLGLSEQEITAVGNDYNDEDMLEWAGQKFLLNNAPAPLKNLFPVIESNNENGVEKAAILSGFL